MRRAKCFELDHFFDKKKKQVDSQISGRGEYLMFVSRPSETTELLFDLLAYIRYNLYHTSETQFCKDMVVKNNTCNCYFIYLFPPEKVGVITSLVLIFNFSSRKFPRLAS